MTARTIDPNGGSLFTEHFGVQSDPPILLIMGAMASGVWWPQQFCQQLAQRGRFVIRYDHRDTGRSTTVEPGTATYVVEDLADDAIRVLDAYRLRDAHLVGMSLGGYLSQLIALKRPELVRTLTLIASERLALADPSIPGMDPDVIAYHTKAGDVDWNDRAAVVEYQLGGWRLLTGSAHAFDEAGMRALAEEEYDRSPNPLSAFNHASLSDAEAWVGRLHELTLPALVIHGTEDNVLPFAHAIALQRDLPNARLVTLRGSGHELHSADWPVIIDEIVRHTA